MIQKIEDTTRAQVAIFLPLAIEKATSSYRIFMEKEHAFLPKDFSDHHKACKVAIAHLELLLKLARWADLPGDDATGELADILGQAALNVDEHKRQYGDDEDDDLA